MIRIILLLASLLYLINTFCQETKLIKIEAYQTENLLNLTIRNINECKLLINRCFEYQTLGEMNNPDLSIFVKNSKGEYFSPIASHYSKILEDCFLQLENDEAFTLKLDLRYYFRDNVFITEQIEAKVRIKTMLIRGQELIPNYLLESEEFILQEVK